MNREVIDGLIKARRTLERNGLLEDAEPFDAAIKALEQEPCEDAVSRKMAIAHLTKARMTGDSRPMEEIFSELPSVQPVVASCEDAISRKAAQDLLIDHFNDTDVAMHYRGINNAVKAWLGEVQSVQPQTVDWDGMIEEIKEETVAMLAAEENDYWDVKYGLFEEDILAIINKYRNGG